jgi:hypothetical protein
MSDDSELPLRLKRAMAFIATLSAILIGAGTGIAEPSIKPAPITISTPRPTPTAIPKPTPTIAPTPTPTPISMSKPVAIPTIDPVTETAAGYTLDLVLPWGAAVEHFIDKGPSTYLYSVEDLSLPLVLAIMANESNGRMEVVSYAGACGLMQVIPKDWFPENEHELCTSPFANIRAGMRILQGAIDMSQDRNESLNYGIAYYNCSEKSAHSDQCGPTGGLHYADRVLNFWLPRVETRLRACAEKWGADFYWQGVKHWGCNH